MAPKKQNVRAQASNENLEGSSSLKSSKKKKLRIDIEVPKKRTHPEMSPELEKGKFIAKQFSSVSFAEKTPIRRSATAILTSTRKTAKFSPTNKSDKK